FRSVFESKNMLPKEMFMIRDNSTGLCLQTEGNGLIGARCDAASTWQRWTLANAGRSLQNGASSACMDANAGARDRRGSQVFLYQCMDGN
ncbi:unnamed protein product, partial [Polarella glacialis]